MPYGVYDIAANRGFAVVGTSRDTPSFAVSSLRRWWLAEGSLRYPGAKRLRPSFFPGLYSSPHTIHS